MFADLALIMLFWQWRPMGGVIWDVQDPIGRGVFHGLFAIGLLIVLVGIIDLIWTQIATPTLAADSEAYVRWEIAGSALTLIALGVLICIAARVLDQIARRALSG